jgi:hypothetical protein
MRVIVPIPTGIDSYLASRTWQYLEVNQIMMDEAKYLVDFRVDSEWIVRWWRCLHDGRILSQSQRQRPKHKGYPLRFGLSWKESLRQIRLASQSKTLYQKVKNFNHHHQCSTWTGTVNRRGLSLQITCRHRFTSYIYSRPHSSSWCHAWFTLPIRFGR